MKISPHARGGFYTTLTIKGHKNFIYGATEEEVDRKYNELKYKHNQGYNVNDNPSMEEYMIIWFNAFKKGKKSIQTQDMYRNCINVHINPALGKKKVKEITSTQVQSLLNEITSSKSLAHKVRITLNQIFKQAIADRLITFNPLATCEVIAPDDPKREFLSPVQRELVLHILCENKVYPLIFTLLYTGMRMNEALALLWKDIDFDKKVISVTKATEFDKGKPRRAKTKTKKGIRNIPIPEPLLKYLKQYKKKTKKSLYVFPGQKRGPMGLTEIKRVYLDAKDQVKDWFNDEENKEFKEHTFKLRFRLFRHTYCTGLYDAEIDEVSAAKLMGHDVKIMRDIYTHISDKREKKTITKLENLYQDDKVINIKEKK